MNNTELPIGIFDSGIGGLTVLKALRAYLPNEHFLYLGDTARLPYGTKSPETVAQYALNANEILTHRGIKALVVACNTASAHGLAVLRQKFAPLPVLGVIEPGIEACLETADNGPVVLLATESTVYAHAYHQALKAMAPEREMIEWPCSLLVAVAEQGWCDGIVVESVIEKLLSPLLVQIKRPSCFLLGCTHFPVLQAAISQVVGHNIPVIDPAFAVAKALNHLLTRHQCHRQSTSPGQCQFMATDGVARFARVATTFLGEDLAESSVELVHLSPFSEDSCYTQAR